jgi:hypothetical protein
MTGRNAGRRPLVRPALMMTNGQNAVTHKGVDMITTDQREILTRCVAEIESMIREDDDAVQEIDDECRHLFAHINESRSTLQTLIIDLDDMERKVELILKKVGAES